MVFLDPTYPRRLATARKQNHTRAAKMNETKGSETGMSLPSLNVVSASSLELILLAHVGS